MTGSNGAVVTGGSRGIGCAVTERVAGDGVVTRVRLAGGSAVGARADVADATQVAAPRHRIGPPPDIADAVCLLVSPGAGWISGQLIHVDGGVA